jgi:hypothetical protein
MININKKQSTERYTTKNPLISDIFKKENCNFFIRQHQFITSESNEKYHKH